MGTFARHIGSTHEPNSISLPSEQQSIISIRTANLLDEEAIDVLISKAYGVRGYGYKLAHQEDHLFRLVATHGEKIVGTLTVILDKGFGDIPTDLPFPDETILSRMASHRLWYICRFAVDENFWGSGFLGLLLIQEILIRAEQSDVDTANIIINPRHVRLYESIGFNKVAVTDCMPGHQNAPAVMMTGFVENMNPVAIDRLIALAQLRAKRFLPDSCSTV